MTDLSGFSQPNPPTPEQEREHYADVYGFLLEMIERHMAKERELAASQATDGGQSPT